MYVYGTQTGAAPDKVCVPCVEVAAAGHCIGGCVVVMQATGYMSITNHERATERRANKQQQVNKRQENDCTTQSYTTHTAPRDTHITH